MELELNRQHTNHYERLLDLCLSREETQELIVPDANPDIREIVDAWGQLFLTEKGVQDGAFLGRGVINGWVLYRPDSEEALCRMDVRIPVVVKGDATGCSADASIVIRPVLCHLEARTLNPRKVLVRADLCIDVQIFEPRVLALCTDMACDEDAGVQRLSCRHTAYLTTQVREKAFSVYEEVQAPNGFERADTTVCLCTRVSCTESKTIGNKLIFKGEAGVQIRYLVDGQMRSATLPVSFSQVMELEEAGETCDSTVELYVTGMECVRAGDSGQTLNITLELLGQVVVREQMETELLQDAYATNANLTVQTDRCTMTELLSRTHKPQSVQEQLETQVPVKSIVDASVCVCQAGTAAHGDATEVQARLQVQVMYLDEQDQVHTLSRIMMVTGQTEVPEGGHCRVSCSCPGEVFATPVANGIEVRFSLTFHSLVTRPYPVVVVTHATLTERTRDDSHRPSVVLRMPLPGERLWDIAKAYHTTTEQICQANALEEADLPNGRMLLIPSGC